MCSAFEITTQSKFSFSYESAVASATQKLSFSVVPLLFACLIIFSEKSVAVQLLVQSDNGKDSCPVPQANSNTFISDLR